MLRLHRSPSNVAWITGGKGSSKSSAMYPTRTLDIPRNPPGRIWNPRPADPGSRGSPPAIASSTQPQSSALRHIGPILSIVQERAIAPYRLTRP